MTSTKKMIKNNARLAACLPDGYAEKNFQKVQEVPLLFLNTTLHSKIVRRAFLLQMIRVFL